MSCDTLDDAWPRMLSRANHRTELLALGQLAEYSPWAPQSAAAAQIPLAALDEAATLHAHDAVWRCAAERTDSLNVVILGGSVSAGCGADPDPSAAKCSIEHSWGRILAGLLSAGAARFKTAIWAKNAVFPDYFQACTGRFVDSADVVLVEFEPALMLQRDCQLTSLINAVRRRVPHAAIVVVGWPSDSPKIRMSAAQCDEQLNRSAALDGADLVLASPLLRAAQLPMAQLYERAGYRVHPSVEGAEILARATARLLVRRVLRARCERPAHAKTQDTRTRAHSPWRNRSASWPASWPAGGSARGEDTEWCTADARELPVASADGWAPAPHGHTVLRSQCIPCSVHR